MNKSLGAVTLFVCFCVCASGVPLEEISDKIYPLTANGSVSVRNGEGIIYIYSWMENSVRVIERKRAYTPERLKGISAEVSINGDSIRIGTSFPPKPQGLSLADRSGTMDYVIFVPQKASVSAELTTGELIIDGVYGHTVDARLTNGRMIMQNCFADTHANVGAGGLYIIYGWWEARRFSFSADIARGHVNVIIPSSGMWEIDGESGDGKISNQLARESDPKDRMGKMRVTIGGGDGVEFKLHASHGNIAILKNE